MTMRKLLIIFVKNSILGYVKTRLAYDIGDDKALHIYNRLLEHTRQITLPLPYAKLLYYSEFIPNTDEWSSDHYVKKLQKGDDLGTRMNNAFQTGFDSGYQHIIIIGSDCYELQQHHLETAFHELKSHDFVIGKAKDGGYYLLGMNESYPQVFTDMAWSTETVFDETMTRIQQLGCTVHELPELNDVDTVEDLGELSVYLSQSASDTST